MTADALAQPCSGDAERVAERCRVVAVLDQVVLRFLARRISGEAAGLPKPREVSRAARDDLVNVSLVACVPDDRILGAVEDSMQGEGQLDHTEVWREMSAGPGRLLDQDRAHLFGQLRQGGLVQGAEAPRRF